MRYETIVLRDLEEEYPELRERGMTTLGEAIIHLYKKSGKRFIVIIKLK